MEKKTVKWYKCFIKGKAVKVLKIGGLVFSILFHLLGC